MIIWDFDGTLLPNDPYDSEQTLLLYKLHETGQKIPFFIRAVALTLLYADQKEHLRKVFKKFYIRFMTGAAMDIFDPVCTRLAAKISAADRQALRQLANQGYRMIVLSCGTANLSENSLQKAGLARRAEARNGNYSKLAMALAEYVAPPDGIGFALIGPFKDNSTWIALCGPRDMRLTRAGRNYQNFDYIRSWLAIQGLDWIRRALLGQLISPADWKE